MNQANTISNPTGSRTTTEKSPTERRGRKRSRTRTLEQLHALPAEALLSTNEVCLLLGVHYKTVLRYVEQRLLPYVRLRGLLKFRKSSVDYFLHTREVKAGSRNERGSYGM